MIYQLLHSRILRALVAMTFVFLPLRPLYGAVDLTAPSTQDGRVTRSDASQLPAPGSTGFIHLHGQVAHWHAAPAAPDAIQASAGPESIAVAQDNRHSACTGTNCDGNCMSCSHGAVLVLPFAIAGIQGLHWTDGAPVSNHGVILTFPTPLPRFNSSPGRLRASARA